MQKNLMGFANMDESVGSVIQYFLRLSKLNRRIHI
jgi:hypothetical protein